VEEEGALVLRSNAWWGSAGAQFRRVADPAGSGPPTLKTLAAPARRLAAPAGAKGGVTIPYFDALPQAIATARKGLASLVRTPADDLAAWDAAIEDLRRALGTAEAETIVVLATRDLPDVGTEAVDRAAARLRRECVGRPIRMRLAHVGASPPLRWLRLLVRFRPTWALRAPPAPLAPPVPAPPK
jgi:hypothetical protein